MISQHQSLAIDAAVRTTASLRDKSLNLGQRTSIYGQILRNGFGDGVIRTCRHASGQLPDALLVHAGTHDLPRHQVRITFGDGACLVHRDAGEFARLLQIHATLDQDAAPGSRSQTADHGDGCRNDQRTRTGNHKNHQRLVHSGQPRPTCQPGAECRNGEGNDEHSGCIDGSESVHESLRRRT